MRAARACGGKTACNSSLTVICSIFMSSFFSPLSDFHPPISSDEPTWDRNFRGRYLTVLLSEEWEWKVAGAEGNDRRSSFNRAIIECKTGIYLEVVKWLIWREKWLICLKLIIHSCWGSCLMLFNLIFSPANWILILSGCSVNHCANFAWRMDIRDEMSFFWKSN